MPHLILPPENRGRDFLHVNFDYHVKIFPLFSGGISGGISYPHLKPHLIVQPENGGRDFLHGNVNVII